MFVRFYSSALDPVDLSDARRIFAEDIKSVFEALPGCLSIELLVGTETNAGGLIDGGAVSRWDSAESAATALRSRAVAESMVRMLPLMRVEPVVKTYQVHG